MNSDFEKQWREKMDNASVHDVLPGFDQEDAWQELSGRIGSKRRVLPVWVRYVAAVLAGILVGSTGIILLNKKPGTPVPQTIVKEVSVPREVIKTDTVYMVREIPVYHKQPDPPPVQRVQEVPGEKQEVIVQQKAQPVKEEQEVFVAKEPVRNVPVVHLLDVENEDRSSALYNSNIATPERSEFTLHISSKRLPGTPHEQRSSVLKDVFK